MDELDERILNYGESNFRGFLYHVTLRIKRHAREAQE